MWYPPNKISGLFLLVICFSFLLTGCGFADFRPIGINTVPEGPWALLPEEKSPVIVSFDTEMDKYSVEQAFQIYFPGGVCDGELSWLGNCLIFNPAAPWKAGIRYSLKLSGTVGALDGRELLLAKDFPFYAVSSVHLPFVDSFSPGDGASVGVNGFNAGVDTAILEIVFSRSMDRISAEEAVKLDIPGEKKFEWLNDDKTLRIFSSEQLNPWVVYNWSISEQAVSREGAPLAKESSGRFVTDLDREFIEVVQVLPLMPRDFAPDLFREPGGDEIWGTWIPSAPDLEQGPGSGHGIGVKFSKAPESESLRRAFNFEPSLPGKVEILSPLTAVFIPLKDPEPGLVYSLRISGSLKDTEGLRMGNDYVTTFIPEIHFLEINSISVSGDDRKIAPRSGGVVPVKIDMNERLGLFIRFSSGFAGDVSGHRQDAAFRTNLRPFFPGNLEPLSLRTAKWIYPDLLFLEWEGVTGAAAGSPNYYKLTIPGGRSGIQNGDGSFMKDDFVLYLEAGNE